jgi:hypothetical protein
VNLWREPLSLDKKGTLTPEKRTLCKTLMSQVVTFPETVFPFVAIYSAGTSTYKMPPTEFLDKNNIPQQLKPTSTPSHLHKKGMSTGPLVFPKLIVIQCRFSSIATFKNIVTGFKNMSTATWAVALSAGEESGWPAFFKQVGQLSLESRVWNQMKVRLQCCMNSAASSSLQRNWGLDDWTHSILTFGQFSVHNSIGALHM